MARYRPIRHLGSGAAGGVELVEDRLRGGPPIALKQLASGGDPRFASTFAAEFGVLAGLSLPGIARVYDLGLLPTEDGGQARPFFTREFIDGRPLDEHLERSGPAQILKTMIAVLQVASPMHRAGVLHRDLKPANIIVDATGQPHLIDFGLAHRTTVDGEAQAAGTPDYMAPELFQPGAAPTLAADVYALGATLWQLLTGQCPFGEHGSQALSVKLRESRPTIPVQVAGLSRDALEVCQWALSASPMDRAPNVDEFASRLGGLIDVDASAQGEGPFTAPRPEGRTDLVERLLASVRSDRKRGEARLTLLRGEEGMGKTTVLQEIRWRLQLANIPVLEANAAFEGKEALAILAGHAALVGGQRASEADAVDLASVLELGTSRGPWVVLVDDIDRAGSEMQACLAAAIHGESEQSPLVIATCTAAIPSALTPDRVLPLDPLNEASTRTLTERALGAVDESVLRALSARCEGNPGMWIEAFAALHGRRGIAAADIEDLPLGRVGEHRSRARMESLDPASRRLLLATALAGGSLPVAALRAWLKEAADGSLDALGSRDTVRLQGSSVVLQDRQLSEWLLAHASELTGADVAREVLGGEHELGPAAQASLALAAADDTRFLQVATAAGDQHTQGGNLRAAVRVYRELLTRTPEDADARMALTDLFTQLGEHDAAVEHAERVVGAKAADANLKARAILAAAHAHLLGGRPQRAMESLAQMPSDAPAQRRVDSQRELARIQLRTGDTAGCLQSAEAGLADGGSSAAHSELLAIRGYMRSLNGEHGAAREAYAKAEEMARALGDRRAEARVMGYAAFAGERTGHLEQARDAYRQCLAAAQATSDIGATATYALNLGNVSFRLGDIEGARQHYALAERLARRAGQGSTALFASNNLAHLHLYLGLYAQAEAESAAALRVAQNLGLDYAAAQAKGILGDVACRVGDASTGLRHYEEAAQELATLHRRRELAEVQMDHAQALLDLDLQEDSAQVAKLLEDASENIEAEDLHDFQRRHGWLRARQQVRRGEAELAVRSLEQLEGATRESGDRELLWSILATLAHAHGALGSELLERRNLLAAAEVIEAMAGTLSADARAAFRNDPRRRKVLSAAVPQEAPSQPRQGTGLPGQTTLFTDPRQSRLLELIKRLATEHDVQRLLERITDAAVELSGAERGFVLLTNAEGELQTHTVRSRSTAADERHAAFSRSIAEAVLIDGEPIVTVDAQGDARVNDFMSVHSLSLRSVACLPIRGATATVGVLYLEHRVRTGRFKEQDVDLLHAFADQAAIAIENARLWQQLAERQAELQSANQELESAKRDVERALAGRTEEVTVLRRQLDARRTSASHHGLVGRSPQMLRVFHMIDRLQQSNVPVVIEGESGTGKELVAQAIHAGSERKGAPFVALNCGAMPEHLLESELFGHVRGAFTGADRDRKGLFAEAHGGTLFLDEFADIPMRMQVDLLRVLQERTVRPVGGSEEVPVDVRVLVACNQDVERLVREGQVREDLFYRLSVVRLTLPPLRERAGDVPLLCDHLLRRLASDAGIPERKLSREALDALAREPLPGNVRQLEHLLMSASVMTDAPIIERADLPLEGPMAPGTGPEAVAHDSSLKVADADTNAPTNIDTYRDQERERILAALSDNSWNRARAAEAMGMPRRTFYRRLKQYGIQ